MSTPSSDELLVFIDPSVSDARKLLKDVRALGGHTTDNIKLANCIVVDQFSSSSRQIIREWGDEKCVLEHTWIKNSKVRGRLTTDDMDMWLAVDPGSPVVARAAEDDYEARETFPKTGCNPKEQPNQQTSFTLKHPNFETSSSSNMDWNVYRHPQTCFPLSMSPYSQYAQPYMPLYVDPRLGVPQVYPILAHNGIYPYQVYNGPPVAQGMLPDFENPYARHRQPPSMLDPQDKKRRASSPPSSVHIKKKYRPQKIFVVSGVPLRFWIQVDVRLSPLRKAILANGGEISTDLQHSDFAIVDPYSNEFQSLLASQLDSDKPTVVPPSFVTESIACLALQDAADYDLSVLRDPVTVKQKKPNKTCGKPPIKHKKFNHAQYQGRAEHSHSHSHEEEKSNKHHHRAHLLMARQRRMRSPTPPDSAPVRSATGWKYTKSERAYAIRYLQSKKGEKMNMAQLSDRLHKKIPHHSSTSWRTYIRRKLQGHIVDETSSDNSDSMSSISESSSDDGSIDSDKPHPDSVQQDVETAANFFARCELPSEAQDIDNRRYSRLSRHAQCKTASSWQDFLSNSANRQAVENRLEALLR